MSKHNEKIDPGKDVANPFPILIKNTNGLTLVEVDGQAVVTASNLAKGLEYKDERSVRMIFTRNEMSFRDFGIYDLSRGDQIDPPCSLPKNTDTALVRIMTSGRPDGNGGGGLQDVRVFTKRGALKVCMKSNQPKAIQVQEMLIDLFEKVESGQLIGAERFGRILDILTQEVSGLKRELAHLKAQPPVAISLPDDSALPVSIERKRGTSKAFFGGLRSPEVREMVLGLRRQSKYYEEIVDAVKYAWPDQPDRHVSKSAVQRFWAKARTGQLKEFGIDVTVH